MNVIYARYNRHRRPPFQIETSIGELNGAKTVVKKALTPAAAAHIRAVRSGYELVKGRLNAGGLELPRLIGFDDSSIVFQYISGVSFDQALFNSFRAGDRAGFLRIIDDYCALLKKSFRVAERPDINPQISAVFGINAADYPDNGKEWLPLAVIDAVFENIIISGNSRFLIDNEWVFEGGVPLAFIIYRSLFYFHCVKYSEIGIEKWIPFEELLGHCRILPEEAGRYRAMEEHFQAHVYGSERCYRYKESYKKEEVSLAQMEQTITCLREALQQHQRVINEITGSFGWRLWRKIAGALDFLFPAGARRRRPLDSLLAILKGRGKAQTRI